MNLAYIYIRVSTAAQAEPAHVSLEAQEAACRAGAAALGFTEFKVYRDVASARRPATLAWQSQMWRDVPRGATVFCYSYDRISRSMTYAAALMQNVIAKNIRIMSVTEPLDYNIPAGYHQLMNVFNNAELSSRMLGVRIKSALDQIRAAGGHIGRAPYGWEIDPTRPGRKLRPLDLEQRVITFIRSLRLGTRSLAAINTILMSIIPQNRPDLRVPIAIDEGDEVATEPKPDALTYANIASILNEYEIYNHNRRWSAATVRRIVYNTQQVSQEDELVLDMEVINILEQAQPGAQEEAKRDEIMADEVADNAAAAHAVAAAEEPHPAAEPAANMDTDRISFLTSQINALQSAFSAFVNRQPRGDNVGGN